MLSASDIAFFFFQAEDGIRDGHVTGVQTCALPIFTARTGATTMPHGPGTTPVDHAFRKDDRHDPEARTRTRSEERRVGKECRARWWADRQKEKVVKDGGSGKASTSEDGGGRERRME